MHRTEPTTGRWIASIRYDWLNGLPGLTLHGPATMVGPGAQPAASVTATSDESPVAPNTAPDVPPRSRHAPPAGTYADHIRPEAATPLRIAGQSLKAPLLDHRGQRRRRVARQHDVAESVAAEECPALISQIRELVSIEPFADNSKRAGRISYGVSSYGYDVRVGTVFKIFTNVSRSGQQAVVDPKAFIHHGDHEVDGIYEGTPPPPGPPPVELPSQADLN